MSELSKKLGRPKGSKNSNTEVVRSAFQLLVNSNIDQLQDDIDSLTPIERCKVIISLAKFIVPQLNSVDVTTQVENSFKPVQLYFDTDGASK